VLNRGRTAMDLPAEVGRIVADRTDTASMRAALEATEWDAVHDVSGFVMAAGGSEFDELLELLDGRVGCYVFVSSIMAYASSPRMPWTEDLPVRDEGRGTYGGFKAYAEGRILDRHARTGFPGAVARPAAIYGPHNNILDMEAAMFLRLRRGLPVLVPHEGLVTTSYGHVDDLSELLAAMAQTPAAVGQVVNATGEAMTSLGYVEALAQIVGVSADIRQVPTDLLPQLAGPLFGHLFDSRHHGILSTEKARITLGLPAERGFLVGHVDTYDWFCGSELVDAPEAMSDPVWGAGYDFAAEARAAAQLAPR